MNEHFQLGFRRSFRAEHALIGGDWGAENHRHGHDYLWEVRLSGDELDHHGYLVDLVVLEACIDSILQTYSGSYLNDLSEFTGLNPSLERFARVLGQTLSTLMDDRLGKSSLRVESILWENEVAWASWQAR